MEFANGFSEDALARLRACGVRRSFRRNTILLQEGARADSFFIVESGRAKEFATDEDDGREVILRFHGAGSYFGETTLIDGSARESSVMTLEPSQLFVVPRAAFVRCVSEDDQLIAALCARVRELTRSVKDLALRDVYGRVAAILPRLCGADSSLSASARLTRQDLADMVGASREMVTRVLNSLAEGGYIRNECGRIEVLRALPRRW